jgi:hypothetical protein
MFSSELEAIGIILRVNDAKGEVFECICKRKNSEDLFNSASSAPPTKKAVGRC